MMARECAVILAVLTATACAQLPSYNFIHSAFLDRKGAVRMLWTPTEADINIEIQAATPGWVGLGFSPSGGMRGADIALGWVDDDGQVNFQDRYALGNEQPKIDRSQDFKLLGGYQNDTHTVIRFSRRWTTCDEENDVKLTGDTVRVIWAYNDEDPANENAVSYHNHRGTKSLYLREPQLGQTKLNEHAEFWDVFAPKIKLPTNVRTLYWCKLYKIPELKQKNHIIGYIPIAREKNLKYLHHIVLYQCSMPESEKVYEKFVGAKGAQCHTANMPISWRACQSPIVSWAVGSEGGFLPDHVGYPLGEEYGGANYFMMEMHYDNPTYDEGVVDDSGLRIYHTDVLRKHDAGTIVIGHSIRPMLIPPQRIWTTAGYCSSECTEQTIPSRGLNVFSTLLHTHLLGKKIKLRQIRDGKELPTILKDDNYDFNYQEARWLKPEMKILPGDFFINECVYDTMAMPNISFGGFGTTEEMCLSFLSYYPKINLAMCSSEPTQETLYNYFGIEEMYPLPNFNSVGHTNSTVIAQHDDRLLAQMNYNDTFMGEELFLSKFLQYEVIRKPFNLQNKTYYDILTNRNTWSNEKKVDALQKLVMKDHKIQCLTMLDKNDKIVPDVKYPEFIPYTEPKASCDSTDDCKDISHNCALNAFQCKSNTYVQRRCKKTCGLCGGTSYPNP